KVDDVDKVVKKLPKNSFEQLTGTMRGLEREGLIKSAIFQRFLPESNRDKTITLSGGTVYLVCTSAGEVGVNISADHLVCDLSTFESMAQRFGRVNRFGVCEDTEIHVVFPQSFDNNDEYESRRKKTLDLLEQLNGDGSPQTLNDLPAKARSAAFAPTPVIPPTSDILFDAWSLTTIYDKLPGRPPVEPYLHGISSWEPPETHVAWREEVGLITNDLLKTYKPKDLLADYPLKPHELLRDNSSRVFDRLKKFKADPQTPVWLVSKDESVEATTLGKIVDYGKETLFSKTVLLPPAAGGLADGVLSSDSTTANDVADEWYADKEHRQKRRIRLWEKEPVPDGMRLIRSSIDTRPDSDDLEEEESVQRFWNWYELRRSGDSDGSKSSSKPVRWQVHIDDVFRNCSNIVRKLLLPEEFQSAIRLAAKFHDHGKQRKVFQTVLGNFNYPKLILAKSGKRGNRIVEKYRHEFGSLIDLVKANDAEFQQLNSEMHDLVLHLIAAHHGRGRPHFPGDEAYDPDAGEADAKLIAAEVPRRFARLQRKYGRWGLAYLESLLRAADYAAGAEPSSFVEPEKENP
ncbi:MAG: type I-U CRISPR-associated helicase/endonuclease Cas3, partial [Planctomycetaceae bacterium]